MADIPSNKSIVHLRKLPIELRLREVPLFLQKLIQESRACCKVERVIVYGSRARGDESELSDWDLAFDVPADQKISWLEFSSEISERAETLLKVDAVDLNDVPQALRNEILRDGIQIS